MKIIFMGTPDFSAAVFEKLNSVYPVAAVVTGLDKPSGRHYELKPCPLKTAAMNAGVQVLQFEKVSREGLETIAKLNPDLIITAAFGQILSDAFLAVPKLGVLNVHASLLPKYRGSSPIQAAILGGDDVTGITIMRTVKEVDAGDILLQKSLNINADDNAGTLFDKLAVLGGDAAVEAVEKMICGNAVFTPQNDLIATHCKKIEKEDGVLDFSKTAREIDLTVRAFTPWPSAYTFFRGKRLKVLKTQKTFCPCPENAKFGEIISVCGEFGLSVKCGDGAVCLSVVQLEGKNQVCCDAFINGYAPKIGEVLG